MGKAQIFVGLFSQNLKNDLAHEDLRLAHEDLRLAHEPHLGLKFYVIERFRVYGLGF